MRICINTYCLLILFLLSACKVDGFFSSTPSNLPLSVAEIQENYAAYENQLVNIRGYGIIEMTMPLCPGYVGMDTRRAFVDEEMNNITAGLVGDIWEQAVKQDNLREFQGYVRLFSGEIGCPGSLQTVTFPYFEIVGVDE
jgi:hypothetical protein